jgi:hypothetical protein
VDEYIAFEDLMRELQAGRVLADDLGRLIDDLGDNLPEEAAWAGYGLGELYEAVEECSRFLLATLA